MITPSHLRIGNWIYPTGRSKYIAVTGLLLGMMEKNAELCESFEGIELTGELLEAAGFKEMCILGTKSALTLLTEKGTFLAGKVGDRTYIEYTWNVSLSPLIYHLHDFQNIHFAATGRELPLSESAMIIPEGVGK